MSISIPICARNGERSKAAAADSKNLLSNAVKFTAHGHVKVTVGLARQGWSPDTRFLGMHRRSLLCRGGTGIGVAPEKQRLIFEAFQQADAVVAQVWRYGIGIGDQPRTRHAARRRNKALKRAWRGQHFTLYLPCGTTVWGGEVNGAPITI